MHVVVGCSLHSGWAEAVVVTGAPDAPEVLARRRLALVDDALPRQVFHAAADQSPAAARELVASVERSARRYAEQELRALREEHRLSAVALCAEPRTLPTDLAQTLANHTLIHSAEGELYREALEAAATWLDLPVLQVGPKRVAAEVATHLGIGPERQAEIVADLRGLLGPPWRSDHKQATLLAMVALDACDAHPGRPGFKPVAEPFRP